MKINIVYHPEEKLYYYYLGKKLLMTSFKKLDLS